MGGHPAGGGTPLGPQLARFREQGFLLLEARGSRTRLRPPPATPTPHKLTTAPTRNLRRVLSNLPHAAATAPQGVLAGTPQLALAQAEYRSWRPQFTEFGIGQVLNLPGFFEKAPALIDIVADPALVPLMAGIVGDDVQVQR